MTEAVIFEERVEVPFHLRRFSDFRQWVHSDAFPESGRIDYLEGRIEVDMSPEDFLSHGVVKCEVIRVLGARIKKMRLGYLVSDRTRVTCPKVELSVEPDIVFVSKSRLSAGRVRLVPKASGEPDRFVEVEGGPDLVVEIASDSSVGKDLKRLPTAYFAAGVEEFWLADARGHELLFQIHRRGDSAYGPVTPNGDGFQQSAVMNYLYRLDRERDDQGLWAFDLKEKSAEA